MKRPDKLPEWASENALIEEPLDEKKKKGWVQEKANFAFLNYWQNKVYEWIKYLDEKQIIFPPKTFESDFSLPWTKIKSVGAKDQIAAGHNLTLKSFPSIPDSNLSFYNLSNSSDQSVNNRTLSNISGTFNGRGIFADPTLCLFGNQCLYSKDNFFNPTTNFTLGLWLTPLANSGVILSQNSSFKLIYEDGKMSFLASTNGINWKSSAAIPISSWCHIVIRYRAIDFKFSIFLNGKCVDTLSLSEALYISPSSLFRLGDNENALRGYYDEFFFAQALFEDIDLIKIFSAKINHNANIVPENQSWSLWQKLEKGNVRPILDYPIWGIDSTDIYFNFFDEKPSTEIALKMKNYC
jgi:hypothetical protein